jgi:hypothetical protein
VITEIVTDRLLECERVIERGLNTFVEVGAALLEIRDSRLYKDGYSTFEDYCRERWGMARNYANKMIAASEVVANLGTNVPIPVNEAQVRPLVGLPKEKQFDVWQQVVEQAQERKITGAFVQEVVDRAAKPHVSHNSGENEWYTPKQFIEAARLAMGSIDTDPASSDVANETVRAKKYYTAEQDGRDKKWSGNVWMNPPYSQPLISEFIDAFETNWYQSLLIYASAVCFIKGRVKFIDKQGNASGAPLQGQTVLYFGNREKSFIDAFSEFGIVLYGRSS